MAMQSETVAEKLGRPREIQWFESKFAPSTHSFRFLAGSLKPSVWRRGAKSKCHPPRPLHRSPGETFGLFYPIAVTLPEVQQLQQS